MDPSTPLRRTPLDRLHRDLGARMVPFAGWEMPVQYAGVIEEHMAVRSRAGLFDVSHMGEIELSGAGAGAALQRLTCNDVTALARGAAQYTAMLNEQGGILDDLIAYRLEDDRYLVIVNAANRETVSGWMREHLGGGDVRMTDRSDEFGLVALQGPSAQDILARLCDDPDLGTLRYYHVREAGVAGVRTVVARTGYTGEDGFELLVPAEQAATVWSGLLEAGAADGLQPAGLAARDTLRLEAGMLLHGSDMSAETTPLEAGLGFIVKLDAGEFIGRDALRRQKEQGVARKMCGLRMLDRGIARPGYPVLVDGEPRGSITSGSFAPYLKMNIARAYLPAGKEAPGTGVEVDVRGRRLRAEVVKTPFYRRKRTEAKNA